MEQRDNSKIGLLNKQEVERRVRVFNDYINSDLYRDKLELRAKIFDACVTGRKDYQLSRARIYELCRGRSDDGTYDYKKGCIFFINTFCWTYSPKTEVKHLPFILFEFQEEAIRWFIDRIEKGEDAFAEKSRDMGASWIFFVYVTLWYWLFTEGSSFLIGSYKEALVDDGTPASLFGKIEYTLESLPNWLLPNRFNKKQHKNKLKLINPANGNVIRGDTMNSEFGRGCRETAILFDELGFWDYSKGAWEGTKDSTNCRLANSTPNGYNYYAMIREMPINIHTMHWRSHPFKDEQWYTFEKATRTEESLAQEIDISYTKSLEGKVYPDWNDENVEKGIFTYSPNLPLYVSWDFGKTDDTALIWSQRIDGRLRILDTYKNANKNIDFYIPFVTGVMPSDNKLYTDTDIEKILSHKYWKMGTHFGDPAGRFQNNVVDKTVMDVLREGGILMNYRDEWKYFKSRKGETKKLIFNGIELNINDDTKWFDVCIMNAAYPKVKRDGVDFTVSDKPRHDFSSHYRYALEYLALGLRDIVNIKRVVKDKFKKETRFTKRRVVGY